MSWRQFTVSWHRAQKKNSARHLKDDPNFYKKRQAAYDREEKRDKCIAKNKYSMRHRTACNRQYEANNNPSTRGKQMKNHK